MQEGDRIAQLIIEKIATPDVVAVDVSRVPYRLLSIVAHPRFLARFLEMISPLSVRIQIR